MYERNSDIFYKLVTIRMLLAVASATLLQLQRFVYRNILARKVQFLKCFL